MKNQNLLEIEKENYEEIDKILIRKTEAEDCDISYAVIEKEQEMLAIKRQFDDEAYLGHTNNAAELRRQLGKLFSERQQIRDSKRIAVEGIKKELEEALAPFKERAIRILQLEVEKIQRKKSYRTGRERLVLKATGEPRIRVITNLPAVTETINALLGAARKIREAVCSLRELEEIFNLSMKSVPKVFEETDFVMSNERLIDFSRLFQESKPTFEERFWPSIEVESNLQKYKSTLESLKPYIR